MKHLCLTLLAALFFAVPAFAQSQPETSWLIYQDAARVDTSPSIEIHPLAAPGKKTVWRLVASRSNVVLAEMEQPPVPKGYGLNYGQCEIDGEYRYDVIAIVKHTKTQEWSRQIAGSWLADPKAKTFNSNFKMHGIRCRNEGYRVDGEAADPAAATPAPGEYLADGGWGTLIVRADRRFKLEALGANGHQCYLEGSIVQGRGIPTSESPTACRVLFTPGTQKVRVESGSHECSDFCGARAGFEGEYLKPAPACMPQAVAAARRTFKRQYDAKAYAGAQATLASVLANCDKTLYWIDKDWMRNDLALAQMHAGDRRACLRTLEPLRETASRPEEELSYPPLEMERYMPVIRATRTNLQLCGG